MNNNDNALEAEAEAEDGASFIQDRLPTKIIPTKMCWLKTFRTFSILLCLLLLLFLWLLLLLVASSSWLVSSTSLSLSLAHPSSRRRILVFILSVVYIYIYIYSSLLLEFIPALHTEIFPYPASLSLSLAHPSPMILNDCYDYSAHPSPVLTSECYMTNSTNEY